MSVNLFVFGRPGSGKSTASYYIAGLAWCKLHFVIRISDYEILRQMFLADTEHKKFYPTDQYEGFDVLDLSVLETSLMEIDRLAKGLQKIENKNELIIIEFARDDYFKAFKLFSQELLRNAYLLYIDADVETCIDRIHRRAANHLTTDDNFVSDYVLRNYYHKDEKEYIATHIKTEYGISKQVEIIDNIGSQQEFAQNVLRYAEEIFEQEM